MQDSRGLCGTNLMFWRKGGKGYGTSLDALEVYTLEEAQAQHDRRESDVPLLKSLVDELSITAVDFQVLPESGLTDENDEYVIQNNGRWNGNDIQFLGSTEKHAETYNYANAAIFRGDDADAYYQSSNDFTVFSKASIDKIAHRTFQIENFNKRKMCTTPGIKLVKPKRVRSTMGKSRGNCPECGKITWDFNPHENAYCEDHSCSYQAAAWWT